MVAKARGEAIDHDSKSLFWLWIRQIDCLDDRLPFHRLAEILDSNMRTKRHHLSWNSEMVIRRWVILMLLPLGAWPIGCMDHGVQFGRPDAELFEEDGTSEELIGIETEDGSIEDLRLEQWIDSDVDTSEEDTLEPCPTITPKQLSFKIDCRYEPCFEIPPTGQNRCFDDHEELESCPGIAGGENCGTTDYCGQDAQYGLTRLAFLPCLQNEEPAIYDPNTGLIWLREVKENLTWEEAQHACSNGWKLPTFPEMFSLIDLTRSTNSCYDLKVFPITNAWSFWTSTTTFEDSITFGPGICIAGTDGGPNDVRCVWDSAVQASDGDRFVKSEVLSGQIVYTDLLTQLQWSMNYGTNVNWNEALSFCESLAWANQKDWRLPSIQELVSILDFKKSNPATQLPLPSSTGDSLWSSTNYFLGGDEAFVIYTANGHLLKLNKKYKGSFYLTLCVRED